MRVNLRIRGLDFTDASSDFNNDKSGVRCKHCEHCEDCEDCKHKDDAIDCEDCKPCENDKDDKDDKDDKNPKCCKRCAKDYKYYSYRICNSKKGFILEHAGLLRDEDKYQKLKTHHSFYLVVSIFVDGEPKDLCIDDSDNDLWIGIDPRDPFQNAFLVEKPWLLQTTVAYKILVRETGWNGTDFPIAQNSICAMHNVLGEFSFVRLQVSPDVNMDFMRRNLEHILSVCSIPMPQPGQDTSECQGSTKEAIALICGDMSGHRIVTSASL